MQGQSTHTLFVVGKHSLGPACHQVPQADGTVMAASDHLQVQEMLILTQGRETRVTHLRIGSLCEHICHCVGVAGQGVDAGLGTHVPHLQGGGCDSDHGRSSAKLGHRVLTLAVESLPPVTRTSMVGCSDMQYTPLRWPW